MNRQPIPLAQRRSTGRSWGSSSSTCCSSPTSSTFYAFWKGRDWIRLPTIIHSTMLFTNVVIILFEEKLGIHAASSFAMVFGSNLAWLVFPVLLIIRMWPSEHPFTQPLAS